MVAAARREAALCACGRLSWTVAVLPVRSPPPNGLALVVALLLATLILAGTTGEAQARPEITDLGDLRFRISFHPEDLTIGTAAIQGVEYRTFRFAGGRHLRGPEHEGRPDLPYLELWSLLPPGMQLAGVDTLASTVITLAGTYLPAPIQPEPDPRNPRPPVPPDPEVYGSMTPYPAAPGQPAIDGSMRGYHIGVSRIFPVRFIGALRRIQVLTSLEVRVRPAPYDEAARGELRVRAPSRRRDSMGGEEVRWLLRNIANPGAFPLRYPAGEGKQMAGEQTPYGGFVPTERPSDSGPPVAYVIITDSVTVDGAKVGNLPLEFQRLADWKVRKGTPAVVRTVKWIHDHYDGDDLQEEIRNFIIEAYRLWGTDWVLLGGDVEIVPDRPFQVSDIDLDLGASVYYGGLDGTWNADGDEYYGYSSPDQGDPFWDVWVGRIPANSAQEARGVVDKLFTYERVPGFVAALPDTSYYRRFLGLTGAVNDTTWGSQDCGYFTSEDIIRSMAVPAGLVPARLYEGINRTDTLCLREEKRELFDPPFTGDPIFEPWNSGEAHTYLQTGYGFVYHFEHSSSEFIGGPSQCRHGRPHLCSDCDLADPENSTSVYGEAAARLTNGPRFSVMLSRGSDVNEHEIDGVSERFILNPNGGAVAFLGKARQWEDAASGGVDTLFFKEALVDQVGPVGQAYAFATQAAAAVGRRALANWNLLGDPEMRAWTTVPRPITIKPDSASLSSALPVRIRVTVLDSTSAAPLEAALVAIKQGPYAYAFNLTDASGVVELDFHPTNTDTNLTLTATAANHIPKQATITIDSLAGGPHVVYESHELTEVSGNGENGVEAGEQWKVKATVKNIGAAGTPNGTGKLRVVAPVTMTLRVGGAYDPEKIYIGKFGSHPPTTPDTTFLLPALQWQGINPFGRPAHYDSAVTGFFVWRDTSIVQGQDWRVVWKEAGGPPSPTRFTGTISTSSDFVNLAARGFEAGDSLWTFPPELATPFNLVFKAFSTNNDLDSLLYNARETNWIVVVDSLVNYGVIASGATADGGGDTFEVRFRPTMPDRHSPIFEVVVDWFDFMTSGSSTSEFLLATSAPVLHQRRQDLSMVAGQEVLDLRPTIRNSGLGRADTVRARLVPTAGSVTMITDQLPLGAIEPLDEATPGSGFRFTIGGATPDTNAVRFRLDLVNRFASGDSLIVSQSNIDIRRPSAPTLASLDPTPNGIWAIWTHSGAPSDLRGYNVYRDSARVNPAVIEFARRSFIPDLKAEISYDLVVTAQDSSGNESKWPANSVAQSAGVAIANGWPKQLDGHVRGNMQPTVADVDGDGKLEVFAGSTNVFAWHLADGTEVRDGDGDASTDGVFFKLPDSLKSDSKDMEVIWAAPFAVADLDSTPDNVHQEVVGVTSPAPGETSRLVALHSDGTLRWTSPIPGYRVLPYASPVIANLDAEPKKEILLLANGGLYVWNDDGTPYGGGASHRFIAGLPGPLVNSPSVADILPATSGLEIAIGRADSSVAVYKSTDGTPEWRWRVPWNPPPEPACDGVYRASTPVLGDIDADGKLELGVAMAIDGGPVADSVFVLEDTGQLLAAWSYGACSTPFLDLGIDHEAPHVAPPAIGNLDEDSRLELFIAGGLGPVSQSGFTTHGFVLDLVGTTLDGTAVADSIPRRHETQPLNIILPYGQPVLADIDGDGTVEGIYTTTLGGIFAVDPPTGAPNVGSPIQVTESIVGSPVVGNLTNRGKLDLVVLDRGGTLHLFNTRTDSTAGVEWAQFGGGPAHTFLYGGEGGFVGEPEEPAAFLGQNMPNPFNPETRILFRTRTRQRVTLKVYGVSGRLVRGLLDGVVGAGIHEARWDGRDSSGRPVPSGVYFYELEVHGSRIGRKMLLLR